MTANRSETFELDGEVDDRAGPGTVPGPQAVAEEAGRTAGRGPNILGWHVAPAQLGPAQHEPLGVELDVEAGISAAEEGRVYWEPELVAPRGVGPTSIVHPRLVHVAPLVAVR